MNIITFPSFIEFRTAHETVKTLFDPVRKKRVAATPEEFVRQFLIRFLSEEKKYSRALMSTETALTVHRLKKRCDIVIFKNATPAMLIECKAPSVKLSQDVFDQAARYNQTLQAPYLLVVNGNFGLCCRLDLEKNSFRFLADIPLYEEL